MSVPKSTDTSKPRLVEFAISERSTYCEVLTGKGRGAVAVVHLYGAQAEIILGLCFRPASDSKLRPQQIRYGLWTGVDCEKLASESVVVTPISDDSFEIHCHGGAAAIERILNDLESQGCTVMESPMKSLDSELLICEATDVLSRCTTARTAAIAMDQQRGSMLSWVRKLLRRFGEKDWLSMVRDEAARTLTFESVGKVLNHPFRVVLCGPPNVGKSSLLNRLVGYDRSITFDVAGTTRDILTASTVIDGWPIELIDTAGIRSKAGVIEQEGIDQAIQVANRADLLILVDEPKDQRDDSFHSRLRETLQDRTFRSVLRILNKFDQCETGNDSLLNTYDYCVSALCGDGMDALTSGIVSPLNQVQPPPGAAVPVTNRQSQLLRSIVKANEEEVQHQLLIRMIDETTPSNIKSSGRLEE